MIILMTFLEILENFADIIYTSEKQKSNYLVFFVFLKFLCSQNAGQYHILWAKFQ